MKNSPRNKQAAFALHAAYIEMLHDEVVSQIWPSGDPIRPQEYRARHLLESAANRPFQTAFGQELFPDVFSKAAALFHSLIANHPFYNGNKRTAVLALDHFLLANGFFLALDEEETYQLATETATYRERGISHDRMLNEITGILRDKSVPLSEMKASLSAREYRSLQKARHLIRTDTRNRWPRGKAPRAGKS